MGAFPFGEFQAVCQCKFAADILKQITNASAAPLRLMLISLIIGDITKHFNIRKFPDIRIHLASLFRLLLIHKSGYHRHSQVEAVFRYVTRLT